MDVVDLFLFMKFNPLPIVFLLAALAPGYADPVPGVIMPFKQVSVPSPVLQEVITEINVEEGSEVQEGQILVQLRNEREKLDVQLTEKSIELRRFVAQGQEKLFQEKVGSEEKAREARTELQMAEVTLEAKKVALAEKTIRSTLSGVVVKKYKEVGEAVDRQEKLMDIINYDQVHIRFDVRPELRKTLSMDKPVRITVSDLDNAEVTGRIIFIDPRNDAAGGTIRIKVAVENKDHRIKPGMKCSADFAK
jgi:RND family efflux transporter MFP subunit